MNKVDSEMLDEYKLDPQKGVRGKYHKAFKQGYSVRIRKKNGEFEQQYFASIESDVHKYYPNSDSINKALRSLIQKEIA